MPPKKIKMPGVGYLPGPGKSLKWPLMRIVKVLTRGSGPLDPDIVKLSCGHTSRSYGVRHARCEACYELKKGQIPKSVSEPLFEDNQQGDNHEKV